MAVLKSLPHLAIMDGFKGKIDFYLWMGIPVARSWPRSPGHDRAPDVEAQWPAFSYAAKGWSTLSPYVQAAYRSTAASTHMTGRDLFVKSYLTDYFRPEQWIPYDQPISKQLHFTVTVVEQFLTRTGYFFIATTNLPCHLYFYWTKTEPEKHPYTILFRGQPLPDRYQYCFVNWHQNEQIEPGDTLVHSFNKPDWPICETRWFTFRAQIAGVWCTSSTAIFMKHRPYSADYLFITETWDWWGIPMPDTFTLLVDEHWSS